MLFDEMKIDDRWQFLGSLKEIIRSRGSGRVKAFISNRPREYQEIKRNLGGILNLYINAADSRQDIERFTRREVTELIENLLLCGILGPSSGEELKEEIISKLLEKADGM